MINRCGSGTPVFLYGGNTNFLQSQTINGPLQGGVAWLDGFAGANCLASGVNCGVQLPEPGFERGQHPERCRLLTA